MTSTPQTTSNVEAPSQSASAPCSICSKLPDVGLLLMRLSLGAFFALAGLRKIQMGVGEFVQGPYQRNVPEWLPGFIATPYGYALPFAELLLGLTLMAGIFSRISAVLVSMMLVSFMIAATGLGHERYPFHPNVIYLSVALALAFMSPGKLSLDALWCKRGCPCGKGSCNTSSKA